MPGPAERDADELPDVEPITINRAPVLTLWVAVVAEREGYSWDEAVTIGKCGGRWGGGGRGWGGQEGGGGGRYRPG